MTDKQTKKIKHQDKLKKIINHYGKNDQTIKCIEELSELTKELCKSLLGAHLQGNLIDEVSFYDNLIDEIADVEIMIDQIKIINKISSKDIETRKEQKIKRTLTRIDTTK